MQARSRMYWSVLVFITTLLLPCVSSAQGKFTVNGRMKVEGSDLDGARAVVMKDGVRERTITVNLNKFSLDLDLNANYIISFEKEGYVSKKLSFNTHAPLEAVPNGFTPFDFAVSLFKQYDDINIVVFNQPVGMIRFDNRAGDFDYDTDYTRSIQTQLQEVLDKVAKREKDEAANAKEREQRAAAEAKEKAKAEAEAAKLAEARAKAAAEAAKQEEARLKAEAAAAKEAEDRAIAEAKQRDQAEAQRLENERKAQQTKAQQVAEKPKVEAPAPVEKPAPKVVPKADPLPKPEPRPVAQRSAPDPMKSLVVEGGDTRREIRPVIVEEAPRSALATVNKRDETRPNQEVDEPEVVREEQLLVEANSVTTVVRLTLAEKVDEYRRVVHKWGGNYYFKNGEACTQEVYQREARSTDAIAGAVARGKMD
ncbi:MAG: hypothetical protein R2818_02390 [Flavobacteriales bacterium]